MHIASTLDNDDNDDDDDVGDDDDDHDDDNDDDDDDDNDDDDTDDDDDDDGDALPASNPEIYCLQRPLNKSLLPTLVQPDVVFVNI